MAIRDSDFSELCSRVEELERSVVDVAAGYSSLASQLTQVITEQHLARAQRDAQDARIVKIEADVRSVVEASAKAAVAQQEILKSVSDIHEKIIAATDVTEGIAAAIGWIERARKIVMWVGAPLLGVASIYVAVKMMITGHHIAPPAPPPPPPGGPY